MTFSKINNINLNVMDITKVWMEEGCITCGLCESTCPEVFRVDDIAYVNEGVNYLEYAELIKEAAELCPVEVIKYSE
jgi:ferredoxin